MGKKKSRVETVENGNTKHSQPTQKVYWFFTFNNYKEEDIEKLETTFRKICSRYVFQEEKGNETGTIHLQGNIECIKKMRYTQFKLPKEIHWEATRNIDAAFDYCQKDETCVGRKFMFPEPIIIDIELRPWQKEIISIIRSTFDDTPKYTPKQMRDRVINWYWEPDGNMGKTTFCKYLGLNYGAIPIEGKKNDILYCAATFDSKIYLMDLERSMEEYVSYGAIEKIKNGYYMCSKYESKPILRNPPHLFIFANFEPDYNALSADRWRVIRI